MASIVHVVSGDGAADGVRASGIADGDDHQIVAFRESLVQGPVVALARDDWLDRRSEALAAGSSRAVADVRAELDEQESVLRAPAADEIVLWFGRDVFCQLILSHVLSLVRGSGYERISLVCPDSTATAEAPCIGSLSPAELAAAFPDRVALTDPALASAAEAFRALASPDPRALESRFDDDRQPGMASALLLHAQRFPDALGLSRPQRAMLSRCAAGPQTFRDLFRHFIAEQAPYGFGDAQAWAVLVQLATGPSPALSSDGLGSGDTDIDPDRTFELTAVGADYLSGAADFTIDNSPSHWLGGVDLSLHADAPRFDVATRTFV